MLPGLNITTQAPFTPSPSPSNDDQAKIQRLTRAFQDYGHLKAKTNPLDLPGKQALSPPELQPNFYGFTEADLDRRFALGPDVLPHFVAKQGPYMTLREVIKACENAYCRSIGAEYSHLATQEEREWVRQVIECPEPYRFSTEEKKRILDRLIWSTYFEKFLAAKFPTAKRFGLEGVESQLPPLKRS